MILNANNRYVLGSRSPRRRELLALLVPAERIEVSPPPSAHEAPLVGPATLDDLQRQLQDIANEKCRAVAAEVDLARQHATTIIAADTTVLVAAGGDLWRAREQPPTTADWPRVVRRWFVEDYLGKTHVVATALSLATSTGVTWSGVAETRVTMHADGESLLEEYLATGEPLGKAGGYAVQGLASVFVRSIEGSLSNVVGLPLELLRVALRETTSQ